MAATETPSTSTGEEKPESPASVSGPADITPFVTFIVEQTKAGANKPVIVQKLTEMGMDRYDAVPMVDKVQAEVLQAIEAQKPTLGSFLPAILGGLLAAIAAGIAWAAIVVVTDREFGFVAVLVGLATGYAVRLFARGKTGILLQIAAALFSVLGIAIGKYGTMFWYVRDALISEYGAEAAAAVSPFSVEFFQFFVKNVSELLSGYDLLWVAFAVYSAWRIPQGISLKPGKK